MESDKRKHARKESGFIVDYQPVEAETDSLDRRAALVNVSCEGLCIRSAVMERKDSVLLLSFPYLTPNPGVIAAKVRHSQAAPRNGFCHGLYVLPLFCERFAAVALAESRNETLELYVAPREKAFIERLARESGLEGAGDGKTIERICRLMVGMNPRIDEAIGSLDELTDFFRNAIVHGDRRDR